MIRTSKITARRTKVAKYYLRGWSQTRVAAKLKCDQKTVSNDLKAIQKNWAKRTAFDLDKHKAEELAKIDNLEMEYWRGWQRSLKNVKQKTIKVIGKTDKPERIEKIEQTKELLGDPRFLDGVTKCIERRCKLLGLDASLNVNINLKDAAKKAGFDETEFESGFSRLFGEVTKAFTGADTETRYNQSGKTNGRT